MDGPVIMAAFLYMQNDAIVMLLHSSAWLFSQFFCRSGATKLLGEGHIANVWIFLLSHP
jgi:hypothetical protein